MGEPNTKDLFKKQFIEWAKDKSIEEIADKAYQAVSTAYDMTRSKILGDVFEHFVKRSYEERKK